MASTKTYYLPSHPTILPSIYKLNFARNSSMLTFLLFHNILGFEGSVRKRVGNINCYGKV